LIEGHPAALNRWLAEILVRFHGYSLGEEVGDIIDQCITHSKIPATSVPSLLKEN